jgi:hypothetical protein
MGVSSGGYAGPLILGGAYGEGSGNWNSGFQPITLGTIKDMNTSLFVQKDANRIQVLTPGQYSIDLNITRSDLPAGQQMQIGYNIDDDGTKNHSIQIINGQYGWSGASTPNTTKFLATYNHMARLLANDWIYFYISTDDGPRSYVWNWRIIKVGA